MNEQFKRQVKGGSEDMQKMQIEMNRMLQEFEKERAGLLQDY